MKKTVDCTEAVRKKCKYSKVLNGSTNLRHCDYLCMKYVSRGCPTSACDKFEPRRKEKGEAHDSKRISDAG